MQYITSYDPRPARRLDFFTLGVVAMVVIAILSGYYIGHGSPQIQTQYVTVTSASMQTQQNIQIQYSTVTEQSFVISSVTQSYIPPYMAGGSFNLNSPQCQYPFNPYYCNEGAPQTVTGWLTYDGSCYDLYNGQATGIAASNFVLYNLPSSANITSFFNRPIQAFGYIYPDWPQGTFFPPYQAFTYGVTNCQGTPIWLVYPYIKQF
jgi:hypothetical protein